MTMTENVKFCKARRFISDIAFQPKSMLLRQISDFGIVIALSPGDALSLFPDAFRNMTERGVFRE